MSGITHRLQRHELVPFRSFLSLSFFIAFYFTYKFTLSRSAFVMLYRLPSSFELRNDNVSLFKFVYHPFMS